MNIEEIDKWLDNEYGCSYTRLEELHDYFFEKYTDQKEEIERLNKQIEEYQKALDETTSEKIDLENIIEEDKKIERLQWCNIQGDSTKAQLLELRENTILQFDKINEIIDKLNEMGKE